MNYQTAQHLKPEDFKRRFGVRRRTFERMLATLQPHLPQAPQTGPKPKLSIPERVLVALEYWREYRTYFHIATDWHVSESTVCRVVHRVEDELIHSGLFRLPGKKLLVQGFGVPVSVMDVTETPIERPKRRQRQFYSGKHKQHTLKLQLVIDQASREVICTFFGKGRTHDFKPQTKNLVDKGYQGIQKLHANSCIPKKKPRGGQLSMEEKRKNRALGRERVIVEHVNRLFEIFRILSGRYRNRRRRFGLRCNLIAAIYNYELSTAA